MGKTATNYIEADGSRPSDSIRKRKGRSKPMTYEQLSTEQQQFIQYAMSGHHILVDACIGSGKTTAIQLLCSLAKTKRILYLTYNKLLKLDAQDRIQNGRVTVTNYHGFCWSELHHAGVSCGLSELIQTYNRQKPKCIPYDVLILDEYQDIEEEIAEMLWHIKSCCPGIQIVAVGDMSQKIYDKTRLDARKFITQFLDNYIPMEFTQCFRIGKDHAAMLGRVWDKTIVGVNNDFQILTLSKYEAENFAAQLEPKQLLVLGSKTGEARKLQNYLEHQHGDRFNKHTLWSKIADTDGSTSPTPDCAIFTTYDGCKGMEREVCILYDWSVSYWWSRLTKPDTRYEIIRNIFCVAASRAKRVLILVRTDMPITEQTLIDSSQNPVPYQDMNISEMFDYKYVEDVEAAYACLQVTEIQPAGEEIQIPYNDALIDLSPCIGHYQEVMFFQNYDLDSELEYQLAQYDKSHLRRAYKKYSVDQKLLYLAALETKQFRYMNQVKQLPISQKNRDLLRQRLSEHVSPDDQVQVSCGLALYQRGNVLFNVHGRADVIKDQIVYELKFVTIPSHIHSLQLAMYLAATGYRIGRLWNVRTNQMWEVTIPNRQKFLDCVATAITKGRLKKYEIPIHIACESFIRRYPDICDAFYTEAQTWETPSAKRIRQYFKQQGLQLPVPALPFGNYLTRRKQSR